MDYSADSPLWTNGNIGFPNDSLAPKRRNILALVFHLNISAVGITVFSEAGR
jgi:hypothetical protein